MKKKQKKQLEKDEQTIKSSDKLYIENLYKIM